MDCPESTDLDSSDRWLSYSSCEEFLSFKMAAVIFSFVVQMCMKCSK